MASAPVLQGQLAERLPDELRAALGFDTDVQRALQFVRSTPGIGTALVGMKSAAHVEENARVAAVPPQPRAEFLAVMRDVLKQGGIVEPPGAAHVRTLPDVVVGDVRPALRCCGVYCRLHRCFVGHVGLDKAQLAGVLLLERCSGFFVQIGDHHPRA